MLTVIVDGRQHQVNGRVSTMIRWLVEREADLARRDKVKIEMNCAGPRVVIKAEETIAFDAPA